MRKNNHNGRLPVRSVVQNALKAAGFKWPCEIPPAGSAGFAVLERELAISKVMVVKVGHASKAAVDLVTAGWDRDCFYLHRNESLFYRGM